MKIFFIILVFFLTNCSLNNNSKFWTEENIKKKVYKKQLDEIMKKQNDIFSMNFSEYKIFIEEYSKISSYPDIDD